MKKAILIALVVLTAACQESEGLSLPQAEELWKRAALPQYSFTYQKRCFCEGDGVLTTVVVANSKVEAVNGTLAAQLPLNKLEKTLTVERLFQIIREGDAPKVKVVARFDQKLGYPTEVKIDSGGVRDGDATITVTAFEAKK